MSMFEAVEKAAQVQLRPMLMTILLALLGLIPATLATGVGTFAATAGLWLPRMSL